jgi:hypothetical protein
MIDKDLIARINAQAAALKLDGFAFAEVDGVFCVVDRATRVTNNLPFVEPVTILEERKP